MKPEPLIRDSSKPSRDLGVAAQLTQRLMPLRDLWITVRWPANAREATVLKGVLPRLNGLRLSKAAYTLWAWRVVQVLRGGTLWGLTLVVLSLPVQAQDALVVHVTGALARLEGYWKPGTLATRRNNPLNISPRGVVLRYPTPEAGWWAAYMTIDKRLAQGLTLRQLCRALGATDPGYPAKLGRLTGLPVDKVLR